MNSIKEKFYPESMFGGFSDIDGTVLFYNRINALIKKTDVLLDVGCGRGSINEDKNVFRKNLGIFKGRVNQVIGIDFDPIARSNPCLDKFHLLTIQNPWPLETNSVDLAFSDHVLEHVENPDNFFSECARVLKKDGFICIRTTNNWGYIAIGAKLIPKRFHITALKKMQVSRKEDDIFPTVYKCNNVYSIRKMLKKYGFDGIVYGRDAEPAYFDNSFILYFLAQAYHFLSPKIFKSTIFVFARKR